MTISRRRFLILGAVTATAFAMPPFISLKAYAASLEQPAMAKVTLNVNGKPQALEVDNHTTLLDALREHLHLTGSKKAATTASAAPVPLSPMAAASMPA